MCSLVIGTKRDGWRPAMPLRVNRLVRAVDGPLPLLVSDLPDEISDNAAKRTHI